MAVIYQPNLFSWEHVEAASDRDWRRMLVAAFPDEELMRILEKERKERRNLLQ